MSQVKIMALLLLTQLIFSGCSEAVACPKPKFKIVEVKHVKFSYKKAKHNYIVPIKSFDAHLKDYLETIKALKFMNLQAKVYNESK